MVAADIAATPTLQSPWIVADAIVAVFATRCDSYSYPYSDPPILTPTTSPPLLLPLQRLQQQLLQPLFTTITTTRLLKTKREGQGSGGPYPCLDVGPRVLSSHVLAPWSRFLYGPWSRPSVTCARPWSQICSARCLASARGRSAGCPTLALAENSAKEISKNIILTSPPWADLGPRFRQTMHVYGETSAVGGPRSSSGGQCATQMLLGPPCLAMCLQFHVRSVRHTQLATISQAPIWRSLRPRLRLRRQSKSPPRLQVRLRPLRKLLL